MGTGVSRKPFQVQTMVNQGMHRLVRIIQGLKFFGPVQGLFQCHPWTARYHFCNLIHIAKRQVHDTTDVTNDRPGRQGTEGDNLRHLAISIFPGQVLNHLSAASIAQIRINIRHGHTFRIEETFKQQVKPERVNFCDMQQVRYDTASRTATTRSDRHFMGLRIMNEIHDDEEIVGKAHLVDDGQFIIEPLLFLPSGMGIPFRNGGFTQFPQIAGRRFPFRHVKRRELVVPKGKGHVAPVRNFRRIFQRTFILPQNGLHLIAALAIKFIIGKTEMVGVI